MKERDPRMLPGLTAKTSSIIGGIALVQFVAVLLLGIPAAIIVNLTTHWTNRTGLIFLEVLGVSFASAVVLAGALLPFSRHKGRRELNAGYTTMLSEFNQVDGISARTGMVVRPAVVRSSRPPSGQGFTTAENVGVVDIGRTPLQAALRIRSISIPMAASTLALVGGFLWFWSLGNTNDWDPDRMGTGAIVGLVFLMIAGLCGVITAPLLAAIYSVPRHYRGQLASHFPNARVFIGVPDNADIVAEVVDPTLPTLPGARYRTAGFIVVERDAIILLGRVHASAVPYLLIPRSRIVAASIGSTSSWSSNNNPYPDVLLTLRKDNGTTIDLQLELAITKGGSRSPQIRDDTQWVVDWATAKPDS